MSEVASKELCQELFELSKWETEQYIIVVNVGMASEYIKLSDPDDYEDMSDYQDAYPAYTLGFMLRKLPPTYQDANDNASEPLLLRISPNYSGSAWTAMYTDNKNVAMFQSFSKLPEDAAAKLAIELIKQNIITPEQKGGK